MKNRFVFHFEKLLKHRQSLENFAQRDWAEAQGHVDRAQSELKRMYDLIDQSRIRAADLENRGGAHGVALGQIDDFIRGQKIRIERLRLKIRELQAVAEEKHELLVEAAKERKILEKLKEKKKEEHRLLLKKSELKELDDIVVTRHGRSDLKL